VLILLCRVEMVRGSGHACPEGTVAGTVVRQVRIEDSSDLDSAFESEDDEEGVVWVRSGVQAEEYIRRRRIWRNAITGVGQMFPSTDAFRYTIWKYTIANKFDYHFIRNCRQRIAVGCTAEGCNFYICVRGHLQIDGMIVKEFKSEHVHNVGEQC